MNLVVFGAYATPSSRSLGAVIDEVRSRPLATVGVVSRNYADGPAPARRRVEPVVHPAR